MNIREQVIAKRNKKNASNNCNDIIASNTEFSFTQPKNNRQRIQLELFTAFNNATRYKDSNDLSFIPVGVVGSFKTPAEFIDLIRNHAMYAEWFPYIENQMQKNGIFFSDIEYIDSHVIINIEPIKTFDEEYTLTDEMCELVNNELFGIRNFIKEQFLSNPEANIISGFMDFDDVPLISENAEEALSITQKPRINMRYANNGFMTMGLNW